MALKILRALDTPTPVTKARLSHSIWCQLKKNGQNNAVDLAESFCNESRKRIEAIFQEGSCNYDKASLKIAKKVLAKEFEWMENEIIK